jgi:hypothetical protein
MLKVVYLFFYFTIRCKIEATLIICYTVCDNSLYVFINNSPFFIAYTSKNILFLELDIQLLKRVIDVQQMNAEDKEYIIYTLDALIKSVKLKSIA